MDFHFGTAFPSPPLRVSFSRGNPPRRLMQGRRSMLLLTCWITLLATQLLAQDKADSPAERPTASIADVAWIAGHWRGEAMEGEFEETWNPPLGNSMVGMFKFVRDGKVVFYELLTLTEVDGSVMLRLKHFGDDLVGWEEKDEAVEFAPRRFTKTEAVFNGLKFLKIDDSTMHIIVRTEKDGTDAELKFVCKRFGSSEKKKPSSK